MLILNSVFNFQPGNYQFTNYYLLSCYLCKEFFVAQSFRPNQKVILPCLNIQRFEAYTYKAVLWGWQLWFQFEMAPFIF